MKRVRVDPSLFFIVIKGKGKEILKENLYFCKKGLSF